MGIIGQAGRVGAMVIVGLVAVFVMYMFLTGEASRHTYKLDVLFNDASGAAPQVPVTLAGVQIGQVEDIHLTHSQKADLRLEIKDRYAIPVGSTFSIVTPILGSTGSVVVTPPVHGLTTPANSIQPGAANLVGQQSVDLSTAFSRADTLLSQLSKTTQKSDKLIDTLTQTAVSANHVIAGPQIQDALDNLNTASSNGVRLTQQLGQTLQEDNGQLLDILRQTHAGTKEAIGNIDTTTAQFKYLALENRSKLNNIASNLQDTTSALSGITSQINESLVNGKVPQNLGVIVHNMKLASDNLVVISNNFAKLSSDQGVQSDLRATVHNIRQSTEQSTFLLERINGLIGSKTRHASSVPVSTPPGGTAPIRVDHELIAPELLPRIDMEQNLRAHNFRTNLDAIIPIRGASPGEFGRIGIYGLGDNNQGILELGQALDSHGLVDVRGGIYASKLAVGADIGLGRAATFSLDAWNPNLLQVDATGTLMVGDGFGLLFGEQNILRQAGPTIGLEYRR